MNCVKCPVVEECEVGKYTSVSQYTTFGSIPTVVMPSNPENCYLLKLIRESKSVSPE